MADNLVVTLPVRLRILASSSGPPTISPIVHCPRQQASVEGLSCTDCTHLRKMDWDAKVGGTISCATDTAHPEIDARRTDFAEAAARRRLHEVVRPVTTCVTEGMTAAEARELLTENDTRAVLVVDADSRLVGIVSRVDVLERGRRGLRVKDVMSRRVHALPENAPVGYAIALMALEQISEVPVVTESGEIVGVWYALDALRWTAETLGYVIPSESHHPSQVSARDGVSAAATAGVQQSPDALLARRRGEFATHPGDDDFNQPVARGMRGAPQETVPRAQRPRSSLE